jgi:hypothetical protein
MLSKAILRIAPAILLAMLLFGCTKKAADEVDFGTLNNSVYRNDYFGFSVSLPADWNVQDQRAQQQLMKKGVQVVAGDDKNLKAVVKASELQTVNLFAVFRHPVGAPVDYNPGVIAVAERTRDLPGIKRGKDYFFHARKILEASKIQVSFPKEYYTERLANVEFDVMELEMTIGGKTVKQKYYTAIQKGYALSFIMSFVNDEDAASLQAILDTLKSK